MSISLLLLIVAGIGVVGYLIGSWRANALAGGKLSNLHSRPGYYGSFVAIWFALGVVYFAIAGRHKLVLSPEEEFAIAHAAGGIDPGSEEPAPAE